MTRTILFAAAAVVASLAGLGGVQAQPVISLRNQPTSARPVAPADSTLRQQEGGRLLTELNRLVERGKELLRETKAIAAEKAEIRRLESASGFASQTTVPFTRKLALARREENNGLNWRRWLDDQAQLERKVQEYRRRYRS